MTGSASNFRIYNEFTHTAIVETLEQASDGFNAASQGAINLTSISRRGNFNYDSFFQNIAGLVTRRVNTGTGATANASYLALNQGEMVSVKLNRKVGPVRQTLDAFKKIQQGPFDEDALNYAVGVMAAKAMQVDMMNTALRGVRAALEISASEHVVPSNGTLATVQLVRGLAKFGDAADRIVCWVMHSKPFYDLVEQQIVANIDGVSNFVVAQATPITLNRPVLVTDSPALLVSQGSPATTDYYTLGLTADALTVEDSEETTMATELQLGQENILVAMQGEFAYNLGVRGFTWDVANGGANPTDTAIGTTSNWDIAMTDVKSRAGIVIQSR